MSPVDPLQSSLFFSAASLAAQTKRQNEEKKTDKITKKRFSHVLNETQTEQKIQDIDLPPEIAKMGYDKSLEFLLDNVHVAGDALKKKSDTETVMNYKKSVKDFLRFVVNNSYEIDEHESSRLGIKKRKKFYLLQVVDQKLDQLAADVLFNNKDQLHILAKIEEINGILVDLTT